MPEQIGRYQIKDELGRGGMATVYRAHDPRFQRDVAIKVLPRQFMHDPRFLERFQQEARTIAALEHYAIVPVYDFGEEDDAPYLVMRFMAGGSLRDRMVGEPMPLRDLSQILDRLAKALDKAHERGIIHRDLKPGNVLFDEDSLPYLADFGIARMAEATHTMTVIGTPAYMSPEQVQGQVKLDWRSDIYALGVMLFELLTGRQPYEAETPTGQMFMHVMEPVPDVLRINSGLPPQTQAVINKAMAKDREQRYQSAAALADAVRALQDAAQPPLKPAAPLVPAATIIEADAANLVPEEEIEPAAATAEHLTVYDSPPGGVEAVAAVDTAESVSAQAPPPPASMRPAQQKGSGMPSWIWLAGGIVVILLLAGGLWAIFGGGGENSSDQAQLEAERLAAELAATVEAEEAGTTPTAGAVVVEETAATEQAGQTAEVETPEPQTAAAVVNEQPITLNWRWAAEPASLDPVHLQRDSGLEVVHTLFMSLTRSDPKTGESLPFLASSWEMNADASVHTFHLRDDIPWVIFDPGSGEWTQAVDSSGSPRFVNAHDVVFGIERTIDPATESENASVLFHILNAQAVNQGESGMTMDDLGVEALDDQTVQFTLANPAAYFPAVTVASVFSAQPQWAIEQRADNWTEPGYIVTNGPYGLEERIDGGKLSLIKNPLWPDADQVQIERIAGEILEEEERALALYAADELDAIDELSRDAAERVKSNPKNGRDLIYQPAPCTHFYGFTNNKPPFDDVRVRTAFTQAIDRQWLVDNVIPNETMPATSMGTPGLFGAPAPGSVGLPFDPAAAQNALQLYLDEKGMTVDEFSELGITFVILDIEYHENIATIVVQMWQDHLGADVRLEKPEWSDYFLMFDNSTPLDGAPHILLQSRCAAFSDEHSILTEVFNVESSANSTRRNCEDDTCTQVSPSAFDDITAAAAGESDPAKRVQAYEQAEWILAVDEAAYAPLYYYSVSYLAKPWLTRNYPQFGGNDFWNWTIDQAAQLEARGAQN